MMFDPLDPPAMPTCPPGRAASRAPEPLDPFERATRDMDQAAFVGALIPALIILAAAVALIFVVGP